MTNTTQHPEFRCAQALIEEAVAALDVEGGDLRSFASILLTQAAALYTLTHGTDGPEGLPAVLDRIAQAHAARAEADAARETFGQAGRA